MLRPDRDHHPYDLYDTVMKLAKRGLGYEDIMVKMRLPAKDLAWVRRIVLGKGHKG